MEPIQTNEEKRLQSVNKRLALRSATALTVALIHQDRYASRADTKELLKEMYKFNLKLLTKP